MSVLRAKADPIAAPPGGSPANPIALNDVRTLRVSIQWVEAVAVVEELCARLVAEDVTSTWVPDAQHVLITAHGSVMIRRGASGTKDPDSLLRMLGSLLEPSATPMPVQLFIAHTIGSGKFSSIGQYAEALAYYGQADRVELVRTLYRRCLETSPVARGAFDATTPTPDLPGPSRPRASTRKRTVLAAAGLACAAAAAAWMWRLDSLVKPPIAAAAEVAASATATTGLRAESGSPVGDLVARAADAPIDPVTPRTERVQPAEPSALPAPPAALALTAALAPPVTLAPPALAPFADSRINPSPLLMLPGVTQGPPPVFADPEITPPPAPVPPLDAGVRDPTIYSSADAEVQPPVMYLPKLPPVSPAAAAAGAPGTNTMDLLIDEQGLVQEVRLVSVPVRLPDMMLLSGAKTWRFHPALKGGRPVRYRLAMSWVVTPP